MTADPPESPSPRAQPKETKALGAGLVAASRVVGQGAQLALMLVGARFLTPAQFGLFALASAAAGGLRYLAEAGWKESIAAASDEGGARQAHVWSLLSGLLVSVLGAGVGLAAAEVSPDPTFFGVFALLSGGIVFSNTISAQFGVLTRRRRLTGLAIGQVITELAALGLGSLAC